MWSLARQGKLFFSSAAASSHMLSVLPCPFSSLLMISMTTLEGQGPLHIQQERISFLPSPEVMQEFLQVLWGCGRSDCGSSWHERLPGFSDLPLFRGKMRGPHLTSLSLLLTSVLLLWFQPPPLLGERSRKPTCPFTPGCVCAC